MLDHFLRHRIGISSPKLDFLHTLSRSNTEQEPFIVSSI